MFIPVEPIVQLAQSIWQQVGPQIQQIASSPPVIDFFRQVLTHPVGRTMVMRGATTLTQNAATWYDSLHPEDKERLHRAIAQVAKDLAIEVLATATTVPSSLIKKGVNMVLAKLQQDKNPSSEEVELITHEMLQHLSKNLSHSFD